ncbi:MAG: BMP family ABC transporter substrate-binding protein, partial [Mycobacteriaceae bacterium]|nr:BMP family ABC transporter substrate-binding protein [Mycobacteriaceae bacterium]
SASPDAPGIRADASRLRVGLAFDVGGRGDASFNDAAAAGVDRAVAELGVARAHVAERTSAQGESEDTKVERLRQLAATGYPAIVAVGFAYADAVRTVAAQFPATKFAIIDAEASAPNVTPLTFAEEQGSFLVGVAAAYLSRTCHIGFVGGVNSPLIQKFQAGFVQGARAAAPNIAVDVKYLTPAGDVSGFSDPAKANVVSKGELDGGADVLFAAAGASGKGTFEAVYGAHRSGGADRCAGAPPWAIGVDSDQYRQTNLGPARTCIVTSMVKRVDVAVFDWLRAVAQGTEQSLPRVFSLADDGVGYSTSGGHVADIAAVLQAYRAQIISGAIRVSSRP